MELGKKLGYTKFDVLNTKQLKQNINFWGSSQKNI